MAGGMHQFPTDIPERLDGKKRVPKSTIRKLIACGQYQIKTLDGTPITDWKKLFEDYEIEPAQRPPTPEVKLPFGERYYSRRKAIITSNNKDYTISQLEHFGDAIVSVSARVICHELFGKNTFLYFNHSAMMITNDNFRSSKLVKSAAHFEIILGETFVHFGIEVAVERGIEMLKTTKAYELALASSKAAPPPAEQTEPEPNRERASDALDKAPIQNTVLDAFPSQ